MTNIINVNVFLLLRSQYMRLKIQILTPLFLFIITNNNSECMYLVFQNCTTDRYLNRLVTLKK